MEAQFFITSLRNYFVNQIEGCWGRMKKEMKEARDLLEIVECHRVHLDLAIQRLILAERAKPLRNAINSSFSFIRKFYEAVSSGEKDLNTVAHRVHSGFVKSVKFFLAILKSNVASSPRSHLADLLTILNWNQFFSSQKITRNLLPINS